MTPEGAGWAEQVVDFHAAAAYALAIFFPSWRWCRRKLKRIQTEFGTESVIHQAATGFVVPAFVMLCLSYLRPELLHHISPHEMGLAGLFALITCLRELVTVGGHGNNGNPSGTIRP